MPRLRSRTIHLTAPKTALLSDFSWTKSTCPKCYSLPFFCCLPATLHLLDPSPHQKARSHPSPCPVTLLMLLSPPISLASLHLLCTTFTQPDITSHVRAISWPPVSPPSTRGRRSFTCWAPDPTLGSREPLFLWSLYSSGRETTTNKSQGKTSECLKWWPGKGSGAATSGWGVPRRPLWEGRQPH